MSESEWASLRTGDIVIEKRSRTPRIVLGVHPNVWTQGPRKGQPAPPTVLLRKLHQSWTFPCEYTLLTSNDWAPRLDRAWKRARVTRAMQWCPRHGLAHVANERTLDGIAFINNGNTPLSSYRRQHKKPAIKVIDYNKKPT